MQVIVDSNSNEQHSELLWGGSRVVKIPCKINTLKPIFPKSLSVPAFALHVAPVKVCAKIAVVSKKESLKMKTINSESDR
jgi:hypothetical protein